MNPIPLQARIAIILLLALAVVGWVLVGQNKELAEVKRIGFQGSDPPLLMPEDGAIDHRFEFPSAWEMAEVPVATRFDSPMGHLTYNAQGFWEMNEKKALQSKHSKDGRAQRLALLKKANLLPDGSLTKDDLDALACLWSAIRIQREESSYVPQEPPQDRYKLPMKITW